MVRRAIRKVGRTSDGVAASSSMTASTVEVRKPRLTAVIKSCWDDTRFPSVRSPPRTLATADALTIDITSPFNGERVRHLALIVPPVAQTSKPGPFGSQKLGAILAITR